MSGGEVAGVRLFGSEPLVGVGVVGNVEDILGCCHCLLDAWSIAMGDSWDRCSS